MGVSSQMETVCAHPRKVKNAPGKAKMRLDGPEEGYGLWSGCGFEDGAEQKRADALAAGRARLPGAGSVAKMRSAKRLSFPILCQRALTDIVIRLQLDVFPPSLLPTARWTRLYRLVYTIPSIVGAMRQGPPLRGGNLDSVQ